MGKRALYLGVSHWIRSSEREVEENLLERTLLSLAHCTFSEPDYERKGTLLNFTGISQSSAEWAVDSADFVSLENHRFYQLDESRLGVHAARLSVCQPPIPEGP